ncbi:MAG: hypothetical protein ABW220_08685 [Burkholderiaceae bacterium]
MTRDKPTDKPTSTATEKAREQADTALDNVQTGFDHPPLENAPGAPDPVDRSDAGGTEPTHLPKTDADRRGQ